jgi:hypothetical protein
MREAEKLERLRPAEPTRLAITDGVPPELDQARLLGIQLQLASATSQLMRPRACVRRIRVPDRIHRSIDL